MASKSLTIIVDPESDLGRALDETDRSNVVLVKDGARFRVTPDRIDPWATYDPERVLEGLREIAGTLSPEEGARMKDLIYRGREEGTRPITRP